MPPEGLAVGNVDGQMSSSKGSGGSQGNSGNRGDSGSGFLIEEDIDSSGNSRGFITGSTEEPNSPRGGAAGRNDSTPFLGSVMMVVIVVREKHVAKTIKKQMIYRISFLNLIDTTLTTNPGQC